MAVKEKKIWESKHFKDGGRTVYDNGEQHDYYETEHHLDNGRTVYDIKK